MAEINLYSKIYDQNSNSPKRCDMSMKLQDDWPRILKFDLYTKCNNNANGGEKEGKG